MQSFSAYVDFDSLPRYAGDETNFFGVTFGVALDPQTQGQNPTTWNPTAVELRDAVNAVMRPWTWTSFDCFFLIRIEESGAAGATDYKAVVAEMVHRIAPDDAADVQSAIGDWLSERLRGYWSAAYSGDLVLLMELRWPETQRALASLAKVAAALNDSASLEEVERLSQDTNGHQSARAVLRRLVTALGVRLGQDLDEIAEAKDGSGFRQARADAFERIVGGDRKHALESACFQFGRDGRALSEEEEQNTPHSLLGFLTNAANFMAPIPQVGRLTHVVSALHKDLLPTAGTPFKIALCPAFSFEWDGRKVAVNLATVRAAVDTWNRADGKPIDWRKDQWTKGVIELRVPLEAGAEGPLVTFRLSLLTPADESANRFPCGALGIHNNLWALDENVGLHLGATSRSLRESVANGLDLMEPLLRGLDDFAIIPDPYAIFKLGARVLRDHVLPAIHADASSIKAFQAVLVEPSTREANWKRYVKSRRRAEELLPLLDALKLTPEQKAALMTGFDPVPPSADTLQRILNASGVPLDEAEAKAKAEAEKELRRAWMTFHGRMSQSANAAVWANQLAAACEPVGAALARWTRPRFNVELLPESSRVELRLTENNKGEVEQAAFVITVDRSALPPGSAPAVIDTLTSAGDWQRLGGERAVTWTEKAVSLDVKDDFSALVGLGTIRVSLKAGENWQAVASFKLLESESYHRIIQTRSFDGSPAVSLAVDYRQADNRWQLSRAVISVAKTFDPNAKLRLERWTEWVPSHETHAAEDSKKWKWIEQRHVSQLADFSIDITPLAETGLESGLWRITSSVGGNPAIEAARFVLGADEEALQPVRALVSTLSAPEAHAALVLKLLNIAAHAVVAQIEAEHTEKARELLRREANALEQDIIPKVAHRSAIREDNLWNTIIAAMPNGAFTGQVTGLWSEVLEASTLPDNTHSRVTDEIGAHADSWLRESELKSTKLTATPAPLEITLAAPVPDSADPDAATKDPYARLAGAAVLLRRTGDDWHCLNAAKLRLDDGRLIGLVAQPISYKDGVATAEIVYDGVPVTIHPPTTNASAYSIADSTTSVEIPEAAEYELIDFGSDIPAEDKDKYKWALTPLLAFGREYQADAFFIHQSGALPIELANREQPWRIRHTLTAREEPRMITYQRTTAISTPQILRSKGAIGIGTSRAGQHAADLGSMIPDDVYPLARDLPRAGVTLGGPARSFFRRATGGTLHLAGEPWSLTIEAIEARGFGSSAPSLVIEICGGQQPVTFRLSLVGHQARLTVGDTSVVLSDVLEGDPLVPVTFMLRCEPAESAGSAGGLFAAAWSSGTGNAKERAVPDPDTVTKLTELRGYYLLIRAGTDSSVEGAPSISFGSPLVQTPAGVQRAIEPDSGPVILLRDKDFSSVPDKLVIGLKPPATDHATWDRHKAHEQLLANEATRPDVIKRRIGVHAATLIGRELNHERAQSTSEPAIPLGLDDPAVAELLFELIPLFARGHKRAFGNRVDVPAEPSPSLPGGSFENQVRTRLKWAQRDAVSGPEIKPDPNPDSASGAPLNPDKPAAGEVWELVVRAIVPQTQIDQQTLHASVQAALIEYGPDRVGPAATVLIEIPTKQLPRFEQLRRSLTARTVGRSITVNQIPLNERDVDHDRYWRWRSHRFAYLHDATLARQCWRWNGRPIYPYPFHKAIGGIVDDGRPTPEPHKEFLAWEVQGFGDRDRSDYLTTRHELMPFAVSDLRKEDSTADGRAQHWRFHLSAKSRYAGLIPNRRESEVAPPVDGAQLQDLWRRAFVPAVPPPELKPPSVRLVLPLTESANTGEGNTQQPPPLLVVLDDPWYDIGGLAEAFEAAVELTDKVDVPIDAGTKAGTHLGRAELQQTGPDPIRTGAGWPWKQIQSPDGQSSSIVTHPLVHPVIEGPIGYTYDTGASAQRFAHSSFIVGLQSAERLPDWSFACLRFRRVCLPEAVSGYSPPTKPVPTGTVFGHLRRDVATYVDLDISGQPATFEIQLNLLSLNKTATAAFAAADCVGPLRIVVERMAAVEQGANVAETWRIEVRERNGPRSETHVVEFIYSEEEYARSSLPPELIANWTGNGTEIKAQENSPPPQTVIQTGGAFGNLQRNAATYVDLVVDGRPATFEIQLNLLGLNKTATATFAAADCVGPIRIIVRRQGAVDKGADVIETWQIEVRERHGSRSETRVVELTYPEGKDPNLTVPPEFSANWTGDNVTVAKVDVDLIRSFAASKLSPPVWCQLAADFSRFLHVVAGSAPDSPKSRIHARDLYAATRQADGVYTSHFCRRSDGATVALSANDPPGEYSKMKTELWAIATERVTDANRRTVERYVATYAINGDALTKRIHGTAPSNPSSLIFRILEIESRFEEKPDEKPVKTLNDLWPEDPNWRAEEAQDAKARIVKVSSPITAEPAGHGLQATS